MSFFVGENIPVREVLAEPYSDEAGYAQDLLHALHGGLQQLAARKAGTEAEAMAAIPDGSEPAAQVTPGDTVGLD